MVKQTIKPIFWTVGLVLVVGLACNLGSSGEPTPQPTEVPGEQVPTQPPPEPTREQAPEPTATEEASGAISALQDVKQAVIQIEAQGTFIDPQFGLQVNSAGRGSGFIIDPSGIAVTNNHVVTGAALLKVWVGGESEPRNARVLGVSECSDLAVIDIEGDGYPYLEWYQDNIDVGLDIYAAGFPLGDPEYTLTRGVISKAQANGVTQWASVESVVEYDATINPGNSGGPVVTEDGNVLAVTFAGNASARQSFGISRDTAVSIIEKLRGGQNVNSIGVNGTAVISEDGTLSGIWVASVESGSPADETGIVGGDIIYSLEGLVLATDGTMKDYCDILRSHTPRDTLSMEVIRFASLELLDGQLNGRPLEVVGNFGEPSGGEDDQQTASEPYFVEEFDRTLDNWSYFLMSGNESGMDLYTDEGKLVFDLNGEDLWVYVTYDEYYYTDVRIDAFAENRGVNNNNISLICRYSDQGWYEFNIANNGLYSILAYDGAAERYELLFDGGSTSIRSGKDSNEYIAICEGNTLSLFINGVEVRTITDTVYNLPEGLVGVSVSSFDTLPVNVEFEWVAISQP